MAPTAIAPAPSEDQAHMISKLSLSCVLFAVVGGACLSAQRIAESHSPDHLPRSTGGFRAYGDFDGDGLFDILHVADSAALWKISTGIGDGTFAAARPVTPPASLGAAGTTFAASYDNAVPAGDFDGDGDLDFAYRRLLVSGGRQQGARVRVAWNDGTGNFPTDIELPGQDDWSVIAAGDLDGDGDSDLVTQTSRFGTSPTVAVWRSAAGPSFTRSQTLAVGAFARGSLAVVDQNGDGDLDVLAGRVYDNDGSGQFSDVTTTRMPLGVPGGPYVFADLDADGDTDCVARNQVRLDDGSGELVPTQFFHQVLTFDVAAVDAEGDGDLDLVFAALGRSRLALNDGLGGFSLAPLNRLPETAIDYRSVEATDLDGDGDADLVVPLARGQTALISDGRGRFVDGSPRLLPRFVQGYEGVDVGDVDRDGVADLVARSGPGLEVFLGDGFGRFEDRSSTQVNIGGAGRDRLLVDIDGDGNLDYVHGWEVLRGDGAGNFSTLR